MILRPYQIKVREMLRDVKGNVVVNLPTGSGKSVVIADYCKQNPDARIIILTHQKELLEQNYEKLLLLYPEANASFYSASIGVKDLTGRIVFAGIQSIRDQDIFADVVLVDECHLISHREEGSHIKFINRLKERNNNLIVIGFTASPFRLNHGLITDKPAIFDRIIEPATMQELINDGYLARLKSKGTQTKIKTDGIKKRGGEFIESELQKAVNKDDYNSPIVDQIIERADGRCHWLIFCAGVKHAEEISKILNSRGIVAECITGKNSKSDRENILNDFKAGKITALTNANVLTTGFDYPDIDLIALVRPTMSASLYIQMCGRGMRPKSHTDHCLVLDFAGNVATHGAITNVRPPKKKGKSDGIAPAKECPECFEIIPAQCKICPECQYEYPAKAKELYLHDDDIMGIDDTITARVAFWQTKNHIGRISGNNCLKITYFLDGKINLPVEEYLQYYSKDYKNLYSVSNGLKKKPSEIIYKRDGKFFKVLERKFIDKLTLAV